MSADFLINDLDVILDRKVFGHVAVAWKGAAIEDVIFDDEDVEVTMGEGHGEIVQQPTLTGKTKDFIGILFKDAVTVGTENFRIKNWKKDGTGVIEIYLERVDT